MFTTADVVRDLIGEMADRLKERGVDILRPDSERTEALWIEIQAHLRAADLCEVLGDEEGVMDHLDGVNRYLNGILESLPD